VQEQLLFNIAHSSHLKLPKVDGLEVLKQLKGDFRTRNIPIVIMNSSKEERDMVSGYDLGLTAI
jgi:two-component system, response regulator